MISEWRNRRHTRHSSQPHLVPTSGHAGSPSFKSAHRKPPNLLRSLTKSPPNISSLQSNSRSKLNLANLEFGGGVVPSHDFSSTFSSLPSSAAVSSFKGRAYSHDSASTQLNRSNVCLSSQVSADQSSPPPPPSLDLIPTHSFLPLDLGPHVVALDAESVKQQLQGVEPTLASCSSSPVIQHISNPTPTSNRTQNTTASEIIQVDFHQPSFNFLSIDAAKLDLSVAALLSNSHPSESPFAIMPTTISHPRNSLISATETTVSAPTSSAFDSNEFDSPANSSSNKSPSKSSTTSPATSNHDDHHQRTCHPRSSQAHRNDPINNNPGLGIFGTGDEIDSASASPCNVLPFDSASASASTSLTRSTLTFGSNDQIDNSNTTVHSSSLDSLLSNSQSHDSMETINTSAELHSLKSVNQRVSANSGPARTVAKSTKATSSIARIAGLHLLNTLSPSHIQDDEQELLATTPQDLSRSAASTLSFSSMAYSNGGIVNIQKQPFELLPAIEVKSMLPHSSTMLPHSSTMQSFLTVNSFETAISSPISGDRSAGLQDPSPPISAPSSCQTAVESSPDFTFLPPTSPNTQNLGKQTKPSAKQRKSRPAALTLVKSASTLYSSQLRSASLAVLSPASPLSGFHSPTRSRAPPPSAPPPDEPLPPIPTTPSTAGLGPRSPRAISHKPSATNINLAASSSVPTEPSNDVLLPKTPSGPRSVPLSSLSSPSISSSSLQLSQTPNASDLSKVDNIPQRNSSLDCLHKEAEPKGITLVNQGAVNQEPSTLPPSISPSSCNPLVDNKTSQGRSPEKEQVQGMPLTSSDLTAADSLVSSGSMEELATQTTQVAVVQTFTRVPFKALKISNSKESLKDQFPLAVNLCVSTPNNRPSSHGSDRFGSKSPSPGPSRAPIETGAPPSIVHRTKESIENLQAAAVAIPLPKTPEYVPKDSKGSLPSSSRSMYNAPSTAWNKSSEAFSNQDGNITCNLDHDNEPPLLRFSKAATDVGHSVGSKPSTMSLNALGRRSSMGSLADRRGEMNQDKASLAQSLDDGIKLQVIQRAEGRFTNAFGEIAKAFRQLQAEKMALEKMVQEKTPLKALGHSNESLGQYLSSKNIKLETNNSQEVPKLLNLLEQQRAVMDYMQETHQVEVNLYLDEIEELEGFADAAKKEAEFHRTNAEKLNSELNKAHQETVQAKAEVLKMTSILQEESLKREKAVTVLRAARDKLQQAEDSKNRDSQERDALIKRLQQTEKSHSKEKKKLQAVIQRLRAVTNDNADEELSPENIDQATADHEIVELKKLLKERDTELAQLKLRRADTVVDTFADESNCFAENQDPLRSANTEATAKVTLAKTEIKRLRAQLTEQRSREEQIRTAYKLLRDELRKTQTGFQTERRRNSGISMLGSVTSDAEASQVTYSKPSAVKLKRLSLPLAANPASPALGSAVSPLYNGLASSGSPLLQRQSIHSNNHPLNGNTPACVNTSGGHSSSSGSSSSGLTVLRPASAASHPPTSYKRRSHIIVPCSVPHNAGSSISPSNLVHYITNQTTSSPTSMSCSQIVDPSSDRNSIEERE